MALKIDEVIQNHLDEKNAQAEVFEVAGVHVVDTKPVEQDTAARLDVLRNGLTALEDMVEASDVVQFFLELIQAQGGRMILLRQWTHGLRAMMAIGIELPERMLDSKSLRPKVITTKSHEVFSVIGVEKVVYSGPFPHDNFPPELTKVLGGDENRPVLIIPLPLRGKWGTFLYIDWVDFSAQERIEEATLLARYAVLRLHSIEENTLPLGQQTRKILAREKQRQSDRVQSSYDDLKPGDITPETLYAMVGELSSMPQVAGKILDLLSAPSTTAVQLEREIIQDLVLTAKILRVANSSFYESVSEANNIRDAIVRLGFKNVRNWTLVNAAQSAFPGVNSDPVMHKIWLRSIHSALGAQFAADIVGYKDRETVFVGGLIQNIGQLIIARALPGLYDHLEQYAQMQGIPTWRAEQLVLGYDHGALGALLIKAWNLSDDLASGVRFHHNLAADNDPRNMAAMIALGEDAARVFEQKESEDLSLAWQQSDAAIRLGVDEETFMELVTQLAEAESEACL